MKICPKCQLEYDDEFAFCSKCGVPLVVEHQEYFCPTCGKSLGEKFESFCPYCGQSFVDANQSSVSNGVNTSSVTTVINKTEPKEENIKAEISQRINEQPVSIPNYNGKWLGFKGRIIRKDFIPKVFVLSFISLVILLLLPYVIEETNLIYNLKYFTSYYDASYLKSSLNGLIVFGCMQIIIGILLFGLTIRRFRDMNKSIWIVIGIYLLSMFIGYFFPKVSYFGSIITFLPVLYGCFGKSIYEDESLRFNNKFEISNLQYICYGIVLFVAISVYSLITVHSKYANQFQQAMSPNGYWINIEDTCFIRVPALDKNSKGIPAYQKPGIKKVSLKELDISKNQLLIIASGNTGTEIGFRRDVLDNSKYASQNLYSSDILKQYKEDDKDNYRRRIANLVNCSIDDVIVRKASKPEKLNTSYAIIQDFSVKNDAAMVYDFYNKGIHYRIGIDFKYNPNDEFQELEKQALEDMVKNIIWKI